MALPTPLEAPVTTATFPSSLRLDMTHLANGAWRSTAEASRPIDAPGGTAFDVHLPFCKTRSAHLPCWIFNRSVRTDPGEALATKAQGVAAERDGELGDELSRRGVRVAMPHGDRVGSNFENFQFAAVVLRESGVDPPHAAIARRVDPGALRGVADHHAFGPKRREGFFKGRAFFSTGSGGVRACPHRA